MVMNNQQIRNEYRVFELKFRSLVSTQSSLNEFINTKNGNSEPWYLVRTPTDYINAIIDEVSELLNSFPWKWWKKNDKEAPNFKNILIEFSDILHFTLSYDFLVAKKYLLDSGKVKDEKEITANDILNIIPNELPITYRPFKNDPNTKDYSPYYASLQVLLFFILRSKLGLSVPIETKKDMITSFITVPLFVAAPSFNITPKMLIDTYKLKYELNKIRQKFGYNKGTYPKIINGKEDNEILLDLYLDKKSVYGAVHEFKNLLKNYLRRNKNEGQKFNRTNKKRKWQK
jgi:hypothetical protein